MIAFFFTHIRSHLFRNISMILVSCLSLIIGAILIFLYQNSSSALNHYSYSTIDKRRFVLTRDVNYFDMFSRDSVGLPSGLFGELQGDASVSRVQAFSFVEIPVLAKFSLFDFGLETDIPVFSVTDSALTGAAIPIGISRSMLDFYNMKIAGTASVLPKMPEMFIRGQSVTVTFGKSKIFPSFSSPATPIKGVIMAIDDNFPGFGITLPESIVREKMRETGYELALPYKIIAYMQDETMIAYIQKKYGQYNPKFDATLIEKLKQQIDVLRIIFVSIFLFFAVIFAIFFLFLLFSFFRERRDVFRIVSIFGLSGFRARVLTLAEPIFLICLGVGIGILSSYFILGTLVSWGNTLLMSRGISYGLFSLTGYHIFGIGLLIIIFFSFVTLILEYFWRRKVLFR